VKRDQAIAAAVHKVLRENGNGWDFLGWLCYEATGRNGRDDPRRRARVELALLRYPRTFGIGEREPDGDAEVHLLSPRPPATVALTEREQGSVLKTLLEWPDVMAGELSRIVEDEEGVAIGKHELTVYLASTLGVTLEAAAGRWRTRSLPRERRGPASVCPTHRSASLGDARPPGSCG
jgi:hypothetical protein